MRCDHTRAGDNGPHHEWCQDAPFIMVVLAICFLAFYRLWPLFGDHSIFHYIAFGMSQGLTPYVDLFEHNFPLIYGLHGAARWISGSHPFGLRLLDTLFLSVATLALSDMLARFGAGRAVRTLCVTAWILSYYFGGFNNTAQRETFALTLTVLALPPWIRYMTAGSDTRQVPPLANGLAFALSGIAMAAGAWIKPTLVPMGAVAVLWTLWQHRRCAPLWRGLICFAVGGMGASAIGLLWLWSIGALQGFFQWAIVYAFTGYGGWSYPKADLLVFLLRNITTRSGGFSTLLLIAALTTTVVRHGWQFPRRLLRGDILFSMALCAANVLAMFVQGKGMPYHCVPLQWTIVLTAGLLLTTEGGALERRCRPVIAFCGMLLLTGAITWAAIGRLTPVPHRLRPWSFQPMESTLLGRRLAPMLSAGETVVLFDGSAHSLLVELERISPFPYADGAYYLLAATAPDDAFSETVLGHLQQALSDPSVRFLVVENLAGRQVEGHDDSTAAILRRHDGVIAAIGRDYRLNADLSCPAFPVYDRLQPARGTASPVGTPE